MRISFFIGGSVKAVKVNPDLKLEFKVPHGSFQSCKLVWATLEDDFLAGTQPTLFHPSVDSFPLGNPWERWKLNEAVIPSKYLGIDNSLTNLRREGRRLWKLDIIYHGKSSILRDRNRDLKSIFYIFSSIYIKFFLLLLLYPVTRS